MTNPKLKAGDKLFKLDGETITEVEVAKGGTKFFYLKKTYGQMSEGILLSRLGVEYFTSKEAAEAYLKSVATLAEFSASLRALTNLSDRALEEAFTTFELKEFNKRFHVALERSTKLNVAVGDRIKPTPSGAYKRTRSGVTSSHREWFRHTATVVEVVRYMPRGALLKAVDTSEGYDNLFYVASFDVTKVEDE